MSRQYGLPPGVMGRECPQSDKAQAILMNPFFLVSSVVAWHLWKRCSLMFVQVEFEVGLCWMIFWGTMKYKDLFVEKKDGVPTNSRIMFRDVSNWRDSAFCSVSLRIVFCSCFLSLAVPGLCTQRHADSMGPEGLSLTQSLRALSWPVTMMSSQQFFLYI